MSNFLSINRFCYLFYCFIQISSFNSVLGATKTYEAVEFNIDAEAFSSMNLNQKLDAFLDVGMKYQAITGKKFDYKKVLKKTYKLLDEMDIDLPKEIRKDIKTLIQKKIEERCF